MVVPDTHVKIWDALAPDRLIAATAIVMNLTLVTAGGNLRSAPQVATPWRRRGVSGNGPSKAFQKSLPASC